MEKDFRIPSLSIQPLIENAIKYRNHNNNKILLKTYSDNKNIYILVKNSFIKITSNNDSKREGLGFALKAVKERLRIQCKGRISLIENTDSIETIISIPKKEVIS